MKRGKLAVQVISVFVGCVIGYAVVFGWIEHRRVFKGPWLVSFTQENGQPVVVVNQPTLGVTNVSFRFQAAMSPTNAPQRMEFSAARQVPFDVPFGQCVFQDTTFLPGTVALKLFGHEIQFMPRMLTVDKVERPWRSGETIELN